MTVPRRILYIISLNHFSNDGSTSTIATLFPIVISSFGVANLGIGILVAVGSAVNMIFQPVAGRYSDRTSSKKLLATGIGIITVSMASFSMATSFLTVLVSIIILRLGSSFFHPVGVNAISKYYRGENVDRPMGFQSSFGNLGIFIVFIIAAPLYLHFGWKAPFLSFAIIDLVAIITTLSLLKDPPNTQPLAKKEMNVQTGKYALGLPIFFIVSMFIGGGSYAIFVNFGNVLLVNDHFGLVLSDTLIAGWLACAFLGALITGRLTNFLGRFRLLILSFAIAGVTALVIGLFSYSLIVASISLLINGFFDAIIYPTMYSELASFLEREHSRAGTSFGILFSGQILGSAIFGFLGGYVGDLIGLGFAFVIVSAMLFVGLFLTVAWNHRGGMMDNQDGFVSSK